MKFDGFSSISDRVGQAKQDFADQIGSKGQDRTGGARGRAERAIAQAEARAERATARAEAQVARAEALAERLATRRGGRIDPPQAPNPAPPPPPNVPTTNGQILGGTTVAGAVIDPVAGDFTRDGGDVPIARVSVEDLGGNADGTRNIRVNVANTGPDGGTFLTPTWVAIQDGSFDVYNAGEAAAGYLEALAEDGATDPISNAFASSGAAGQDGVVTGPAGLAAGPLDTGESGSIVLTVDPRKSQFLSYASMVIPSNDAFIASPDNPTALRIFDDHGNFVGGVDEARGSDVLDAGTEVNTEDDAAFLNQTAPNTGVDEGGVVSLHPGFIGSEGLTATDAPEAPGRSGDAPGRNSRAY